jgi:uncharacterized protein
LAVSVIGIPLTMSAVFRVLPHVIGTRPGYFLSFIFYWAIWCGAFPALVRAMIALADYRHGPDVPLWPHPSTLALLLWPLLVTYTVAFPRFITSATMPIVVASAMLAGVNGVAEEWLWRGTFLKLFPNERLRGVVIPSVGFGVWHFAPQLVFSNHYPGGAASLVGFSVLLGLSWGEVVRRTDNLRLVMFCHVLLDFSGLGGRLYIS